MIWTLFEKKNFWKFWKFISKMLKILNTRKSFLCIYTYLWYLSIYNSIYIFEMHKMKMQLYYLNLYKIVDCNGNMCYNGKNIFCYYLYKNNILFILLNLYISLISDWILIFLINNWNIIKDLLHRKIFYIVNFDLYVKRKRKITFTINIRYSKIYSLVFIYIKVCNINL